jgi:hypothetical protein
METNEFLQRLDKLCRLQEEKAELIARPLRLLPGEDPGSPYPADAEEWAGVYRELATFKEGIVRQVQARAHLSHVAEAEAYRDEEVLQTELERLRLHLRYWDERRSASQEGDELEAN